MEKIRIIIVDDCLAICKSLSNSLGSVPEFEVVKAINEPLSAVSEIIRLKPDVLLLDAVMSPLDGDDILESLPKTLDFKLGIIIISPINNDMTISHYSELGAHYFIAKPINIDRLIKKIKYITESLRSEETSYSISANSETRHITEPESDSRLNSKITRLLIKVGINPKLKGFCFLKESISFICLSGNELSSVTKIVYPKIAKDYLTESEKVERAIRTAIEKAFSTGQADAFYYDIIGSCRERKPNKRYPSNREFICMLAEYIKHAETADLMG